MFSSFISDSLPMEKDRRKLRLVLLRFCPQRFFSPRRSARRLHRRAVAVGQSRGLGDGELSADAEGGEIGVAEIEGPK